MSPVEWLLIGLLGSAFAAVPIATALWVTRAEDYATDRARIYPTGSRPSSTAPSRAIGWLHVLQLTGPEATSSITCLLNFAADAALRNRPKHAIAVEMHPNALPASPPP